MIINYNCNCSFIVLATVIIIVNYDRKTFIVQATERQWRSKKSFVTLKPDWTGNVGTETDQIRLDLPGIDLIWNDPFEATDQERIGQKSILMFWNSTKKYELFYFDLNWNAYEIKALISWAPFSAP